MIKSRNNHADEAIKHAHLAKFQSNLAARIHFLQQRGYIQFHDRQMQVMHSQSIPLEKLASTVSVPLEMSIPTYPPTEFVADIELSPREQYEQGLLLRQQLNRQKANTRMLYAKQIAPGRYQFYYDVLSDICIRATTDEPKPLERGQYSYVIVSVLADLHSRQEQQHHVQTHRLEMRVDVVKTKAHGWMFGRGDMRNVHNNILTDTELLLDAGEFYADDHGQPILATNNTGTYFEKLDPNKQELFYAGFLGSFYRPGSYFHFKGDVSYLELSKKLMQTSTLVDYIRLQPGAYQYIIVAPKNVPLTIESLSAACTFRINDGVHDLALPSFDIQKEHILLSGELFFGYHAAHVEVSKLLFAYVRSTFSEFDTHKLLERFFNPVFLQGSVQTPARMHIYQSELDLARELLKHQIVRPEDDFSTHLFPASKLYQSTNYLPRRRQSLSGVSLSPLQQIKLAGRSSPSTDKSSPNPELESRTASGSFKIISTLRQERSPAELLESHSETSSKASSPQLRRPSLGRINMDDLLERLLKASLTEESSMEGITYSAPKAEAISAVSTLRRNSVFKRSSDHHDVASCYVPDKKIKR